MTGLLFSDAVQLVVNGCRTPARPEPMAAQHGDNMAGSRHFAARAGLLRQEEARFHRLLQSNTWTTSSVASSGQRHGDSSRS